MRDNHDLEFAALQAVGRVDRDLCYVRAACPGERGPDQVGLVAVGDADRDVTGVQNPAVVVAFAGGDRAAVLLARLSLVLQVVEVDDGRWLGVVDAGPTGFVGGGRGVEHLHGGGDVVDGQLPAST